MVQIYELPTELLLEIFARVQESSSPGALATAMLCCQKWHALASSVLYAHIAVDSKLNENTSSCLLARQSTYFHLIQSFSLRIHQVQLMGFSIDIAKACDRLSEICYILPRLQNLKTFSLTLEDNIGRKHLLRSRSIINILGSLPKTVVNLELDCGGLDDIAFSGLHACEAIGALIPQLEWLRLRISHLCPALLSQLQGADADESGFDIDEGLCMGTNTSATSKLRYAIIRLDGKPESMHSTTACLCDSGGQLLDAQGFATLVRDVYLSGSFPALRRLILIDRVEAIPMAHGEHWDAWKVRDITNDVTMTFPWCARGGSSYLHMVRAMDGEDWFGSFGDVSDSLEGPLTWSETASRTRFPPPKVKDEGIGRGWQLDLRKLSWRPSVVKQNGVAFRVWKHEEMTGNKLVEARAVTGFDDIAAASEDLPGGWRWVPEGRWRWTIEAR